MSTRINTYNPLSVLSGSTLKLIACALMLVDHIGLILCPSLDILRMIGRLAFPLFAFFIAEGCRHTRHKLRRLLWLAVPAVLMLVIYRLYDGAWQGNIFLTFTYSATLIWLLDVACDTRGTWRAAAIVGFFSSLAALWWLCGVLPTDYGYYGVLVPVFVRAADMLTPRNSHYARLAGLAVGLLLLACDMGGIQYLSLLSLIPLALYDGERGRYPLKYFFYAFYPLHLILLQLIAML